MALEAHPLHIPLRIRHRQASSDRTVGESVWVIAERGGVRGVGEGTPRPYVTGEDVPGSLAWIERIAPEVDGIDDVAALRAWVDANEAELDRHPAAWCAVETAILDRIGRATGRSIEAMLGLPAEPTVFRYTAILSDLPLEKSKALLGQAVAAGIRTYKLKLGGDLATDRARLAMVHEAVPDASVRLDANNLWGEDVDAALAHLRALGAPFEAVEEPLSPRRAADLARIGDALGVGIVLDESLANLGDIDRYTSLDARWIANVKVAKAGGPLRSTALVQAAAAVGWPVVIGAHVGETSVLTRLGQTAARAAGDHLLAMEGAGGLLFMERDPVRPVLQLGARGEVDSTIVGPHGLGLEPEES